MNERIKFLQSLCWKELDSEEAFYSVFDYEKFANLIIRDCLSFVEPTPGSGDLKDMVLKEAYNEIKEHFGI